MTTFRSRWAYIWGPPPWWVQALFAGSGAATVLISVAAAVTR